jgi:hypothetical protein
VRDERRLIEQPFDQIKVNLQVLARDWYRCSHFIELLAIQEELTEPWKDKMKFCKLRAAYTVSCIADGVKPILGNPFKDDQFEIAFRLA